MPRRPIVKKKRDMSKRLGKNKVSKFGQLIMCNSFHMLGYNKVTYTIKNERSSKLRVKRKKISKTN